MVSTTTVVAIGVSAILVAVGGAGLLKMKSQPAEKSAKQSADTYVLGFKVKDLDGKEQDLEQYKGKVLLFVNVASECGYTPQYEGLESLYTKNKDRGFVVLGFPANNFGGQEPGSNAEIKQFCSTKFKVDFPMFEKISVKGDDRHPLYAKLADAQGEPNWNFTKYLVDKNGNVVARFDSKVKPNDPELAKKIDELLAAK